MSTRGALAADSRRETDDLVVRQRDSAVDAAHVVPAKPIPAATLCRPNGCNTGPANDTSTPSPRAAGVAGHRHRVAQIGRAVRVGCVGAAHRSGDHQRDGAVVGEVQPQRRLLEGVGAVCHDHASSAAVGRRPGCRADDVPVGRAQLRAVLRHHVDHVDVQPGGEFGTVVDRPLHPVGPCAAGDGPAGGDDGHAAHLSDHPACRAVPRRSPARRVVAGTGTSG